METIIPIVIYIVIPVIGIMLFLLINKTLKPIKQKELFTLKLLLVFGCMGGLTLLLATTLFWKWSGLAAIGSVFLILIAPIIIAVIAYDSFKKRADDAESKLFKLALSYFVALPLIFLIAFMIDK